MMFSYEPYRISIGPIGKTHWIFGLSLLYLIHGCGDRRCGARGKKMDDFGTEIAHPDLLSDAWMSECLWWIDCFADWEWVL